MDDGMSEGICYIQDYKNQKEEVIIMDKESSPFKQVGVVWGKMITTPN